MCSVPSPLSRIVIFHTSTKPHIQHSPHLSKRSHSYQCRYPKLLYLIGFFFSMLNNMIPIAMPFFLNIKLFPFHLKEKNTQHLRSSQHFTMSRDKAFKRCRELVLVMVFKPPPMTLRNSKFIYACNPCFHVQSGRAIANHPKFRGYKIGVVLGTQQT